MRAVDWFCGIGGFRLALEHQDYECVASCEISKFPRKVYRTRFGAAPTYKDVTRVEAKKIPQADLWVGGFPCQDVSSAGAGLGLLGGKRSSLVFRLLGLAAVARPQWILLENTPGLLFRGRGYGRLLGVLARLGYGFCWRRLDAQHFGVAQRRKRIFVLACLGARAGMRRAAEVLLEPEGLRRDPPPRPEAREGVARALASSAAGRSWPEPSEETLVSAPVTAKWAKGGGPSGDECQNLVARSPGLAATLTAGIGITGNAPGRRREDDVNLIAYAPDASPTLQASAGHHGHSSPRGDGSTPLVAYAIPSDGSKQKNCPATEVAKTLDSNGAWGRGAGGTVVIPFNAAQITHPENRARCDPGEPAHTLAVSGEPETIAEQRGRFVRRLTPLECERLQGFPDHWTAVEGASDAARYRALGNAVAVPCVEWIVERLRRLS